MIALEKRASALRLVTADEIESSAAFALNARGLSPAISLSQFIDRFVIAVWLPERRASAKTICCYRESRDYWREFTGDPALDAIDDFTTSTFLQKLYALPGRAPKGQTKDASPYTIRKHVQNIQTCLCLAGPRTGKHRKAQRLIDEAPFLERPRIDRGEVDDNFTLDEIGQILEGAEHMRVPKIAGIPAPAFWRALATLAYNTAERRYALLHVDQPACGAVEIVFPRGIRKGRALTHRVPLNEWARAAIESIRTDRKLLFPWPYSETEREKLRYFGRCWERLLTHAGIPEERRFGLHGLRKATATEMAAYDPMAAIMTTGHQQWSTFQRYYAGRKIKAEGLGKLPQPVDRRKRPPDADGQQLLF